MASLIPVGDGFQCKFYFGGKQFKPSLATKNRRDAENHMAQIEDTIRLLNTGRLDLPPNATKVEIRNFIVSGGRITEKPVVGNPQSLSGVISAYLDANDHKEASTIAGERIHTGHFQRILGDVDFNQIDADALRGYVKRRLSEPGLGGKKLSAETVKKEFRTWNQIWKYAVQQKIVVGTSPHKEVALRKTDEKDPFRTWVEIEKIINRGNLTEERQKEYWDALFLDSDQVKELLEFVKENARHAFIHPAVAMAAFTGARRSEIFRSRIEDWDFESEIVRIRGRKGSRSHRTTFRDVPITPELNDIVQSWFETSRLGGRYSFCLESDKKLTENQAHDHFKRTLSSGKWKVVRGWHVLRHSFCSNCARRGTPDTAIDEWMGHKGDEAIKKRYRHLFPSDQHEYIRKVFA